MGSFYDRVITVYGRKPVLEALKDPGLECHRLHFADSNRPAPALEEMRAEAERRGIEICIHSKRELSRISRKGSQDQGVALDVLCPGFCDTEEFLAGCAGRSGLRVIAADGVTNPQNAGMLIRSALAGGVDAVLWPSAGNAALGPLAIKASAGTLFRARLVRTTQLATALPAFRDAVFQIYVLDAGADATLGDGDGRENRLYVLGNESEGVSAAVRDLAHGSVSIPMQHGVESLNVAVTAALVAYLDRGYLER